MIEYFKGIFFLISYIFLMYIFGTALISNDETAPKRFVVGYISFAAIIAVVGIPIQLLALSWKIFMCFLCILIIGTLIFSIYNIYKQKKQLFYGNLKEFIKKYWFLILIPVLLVIISSICFDWYWLNNCLDDGYYVNRIATLPYIKNPFATIPGTGLLNNVSFANSYNYNVFELEASVYVYLLNIVPTLFARCFLATINYFLFGCVLYCFFDKIITIGKFNISEYMIQYLTTIMLLFSFNYNLSSVYNILKLQDGWQNITAMYYGSSIVRNMGILILITPLLDSDKLDIKKFFWFCVSALMLMSKSSIALPFIVIIAITYCLIYFLKSRNIFGLIAIIALLLLGGIILHGNAGMAAAYRGVVKNNLLTKTLIISIILIIITLLLEKSPILFECGEYIIIMGVLTLVEPINNIFEKFSIYDFVACRFSTGIFVMMIAMGMLCIIILISHISIVCKLPYILKTCIILSCSVFLTFYSLLMQTGFSISNLEQRFEILRENKYFSPQSLVILGETLEKLSNESDNKIYALMPEGVGVYGVNCSLAISIRQFAPSIVSLSAYTRYPGTCEKDFLDYDGNNQRVYDEFVTTKSDKSVEALENILEKYPINCIVTISPFSKEMKELGFKKYNAISNQNSYYIYYR